MSVLSSSQRNSMPASSFAGPNRSYPVPDANHARNALARVSQFGSPQLQARVRALVSRRFPGIAQQGAQKFSAGGVVSPFQLGGQGAMLDPTPLSGGNVKPSPWFDPGPVRVPGFVQAPPISTSGVPTLMPGQQAQIDAQGSSFLPVQVGPIGSDGSGAGALSQYPGQTKAATPTDSGGGNPTPQFNMDPHNTQPIGKSAGGAAIDPTLLGGSPVAASGGGYPSDGGTPPVTTYPGWVPTTGNMRQVPDGYTPPPDAALTPGSQSFLMQQKFGGGPPVQGFSRGGMIPFFNSRASKVARPPQFPGPVAAYKSRLG